MSNAVFPSYLSGIAWPVKRTSMYATHVQQALSGKESRIALKQYPQYKYALDINIMRDDLTRSNHAYNSANLASCTFYTATTGSTTTDYVAPDGTYSAAKIVYTGAGSVGQSLVAWAGDINSGVTTTQYTVSVWVRCASGTVSLRLSNGQTAGITPITVTTSWQRFQVTSVGSTSQVQALLYLATGSSAAATVYTWGPQIEIGSDVTGYVPTFSAVAISATEYRLFAGFYSLMQGQWDTFLYLDPNWCTENNQQFGTGDGTTTSFQLLGGGGPNYNSLAGFDLVQNVIPFSGLNIYVNGVLKTLTTDYTVGSSGIITFTTAPANTTLLTWTGSYYQRCRFLTDEMEFSEFMNNWWENMSIELQVIKL
jgi:hypothetical protein